MSEFDAVGTLIADIYDAALDAALWPGVMERICNHVRGCGAGLIAEDRSNARANLFHHYRYDPAWTQLYIERYVALNPLPRLGSAYPVGEVFTQFDLVPEDEFRASAFFKEWVQPQGFADCAVVNLDKTTTSFAALVVRRSEQDGAFDDEARTRLAQIAPHVRRAVLVGKTIQFHETKATLLSETLSNLAAAVFLLAVDGRIVFGNEAAQTLLRDGELLRDSQGFLTLADAKAERALRDTLAMAARGDSALGGRGAAIELAPEQDDRWLAHALPLTSGARQLAGKTHSAAVALFVRRASLDLQLPLDTIGKLYDLTAGELRVLQAIVDVGGVPAIAEKYGISAGTVRTHVKSIFNKTGVKRQADLIKLVATHIPPFGA
jgi:DNA-binding CsgD family transcriptional regulator/PAS domain-containing protein